MPKIKHECGIAFLRLRKPLQYYIDKYKTPSYPVGKMFLMMHKQRNRGQDGAGVASLKLNTQPGMTSLSLVPEIAAFKKISFIKLIELILKDAINNK